MSGPHIFVSYRRSPAEPDSGSSKSLLYCWQTPAADLSYSNHETESEGFGEKLKTKYI